MGSKFGSELSTRDGVTTLKVVGVIDEDNELAGLESKITSGPTVLDLGEIDRINSCGVRDWVNWLGRIEKQGARLVFVNCSPAIVAQINLVHNFTASGVVKSFYAPYFCKHCEKEKLLRLETRELAKSAPIATAPTCRCDECDRPMEFDDMEESYFAFLNNAKKVLGDPSFERTLAEVAAATDGARMKPRTTGGGNVAPVTAGSTGPGPGSTTGTGPGTGSGSMTPATSTPSTVSPTHRTPTSKTPPGSTPTGGPKLSASISNSQPAVVPVRPELSGGTDRNLMPPQQLSPAAAATREGLKAVPNRPLLPWILLGAFLLAAAGILVLALAR